jgi:hypothetical protein
MGVSVGVAMVLENAPGAVPAIDAGSTPGVTTPASGQPETTRPRYLIVVARDQPDLWRHLRKSVGELKGVDVVLDRRHGGRWQWAQSSEYEQRGMDRRRATDADNRLSHRSVMIVHPEGSSPTTSQS